MLSGNSLTHCLVVGEINCLTQTHPDYTAEWKNCVLGIEHLRSLQQDCVNTGESGSCTINVQARGCLVKMCSGGGTLVPPRDSCKAVGDYANEIITKCALLGYDPVSKVAGEFTDITGPNGVQYSVVVENEANNY